jgi:hypothetical protein
MLLAELALVMLLMYIPQPTTIEVLDNGQQVKDAIVLIHSLDSPPSEFIPDGSGQLTDGRGTVTVALKTRHRELFVFASLANGSKTAEAVIKANEMGLFQSRLRLHLEEEIK